MAIPASLLTQLERHSCFSGCYGREAEMNVCLDPTQALEPMLFISCRDCLTFKLGVLQSLLPAGTTADGLADQVTQHMRTRRGYLLSFGGYHARGPGFWLSAAYYPGCGIFLIDGARSRSAGTDLELLLLAFRHGVAQPPDPLMLDPKCYTTQTAYVNFSVPLYPVNSKQDLLSAPQCLLQPAQGHHRVTLAEFLPIARHAGSAPPSSTSILPLATAVMPPSSLRSRAQSSSPVHDAHAQPNPTAKRLRVGDVCPVCKAQVLERPLLNATFVGCLC